jgi:hypothetical protein
MIEYYKIGIERIIAGLEAKPSFALMAENACHINNKLNKIWEDIPKECFCTEHAMCENCENGTISFEVEI